MQTDPANNSSSHEDDLPTLLSVLASSRPDNWAPSQRRTVTLQAQSILDHNPQQSLPILIEWNETTCSSQYAYRRIIALYSHAVLVCFRLDTKQSSFLLAPLIRPLVKWLQHSKQASQIQTCARFLTRNLTQTHQQDELAQLLLYQDSSETTIAALALGCALMNSSSSLDWASPLFRRTIAQWPSSDELALATHVMATVTPTQWSKDISPTFLWKLKSHPDKALPVVATWITAIPPERLSLISDEWMTTIWNKHILIMNPNHESNRPNARDILQHWAHQSTQSARTIVQTVVTVPTSQASARLACYHMMQRLAHSSSILTFSIEEEAEAEENNFQTRDDWISTIVKHLVQLVQKDTKQENELKQAGIAALVDWIGLMSSSGYSSQEALAVFQNPVWSTTKIQSVSLPWGTLVRRVPSSDQLESIIGQLWIDTQEWNQGIQSILELANTKKSAHLDGLLVVYFALVYHARNNNHTQPLLPAVEKVLASGASTKDDTTSFLFSNAMLESIQTSNSSLASLILPRILMIYTELSSQQRTNGTSLFPKNKLTAGIKALTTCITHPCVPPTLGGAQTKNSSSLLNTMETCVQSILTHCPESSMALTDSLLNAIHTQCIAFENGIHQRRATRQARSQDDSKIVPMMKGKGSPNASHRGFDPHSVRTVGRMLGGTHIPKDSWELWAKTMILIHAGATVRTKGPQRQVLVAHTTTLLNKDGMKFSDDFLAGLADAIVGLGSDGQFGSSNVPEKRMSHTVHRATCSLLISLGLVASNFSPDVDDPEDPLLTTFYHAYALCTEWLAPRLASRLNTALEKLQALSSQDVALLSTHKGTLFQAPSKADAKKSSKRKTEEEEWDAPPSKSKNGTLGNELSAEDKKIVADQDKDRDRMHILVRGDFDFTLDSIRLLSLSDIEIGNACLVNFAEPVTQAAVSTCPAIKSLPGVQQACNNALYALSTCVYEIDDGHAAAITQSVLISCRKERTATEGSQVNEPDVSKHHSAMLPLPSPCGPVVRCVQEVSNFGDALSGPSFHFIFPIIQACLMGPRTTAGCEDALSILERHAQKLYGDDQEKVILQRRKDMIVCVLELLKHDRSQTFQEPSAFDTLEACVRTEADVPLSTGELAPLLDHRGALGKPLCRLGSMKALGVVAPDHKATLRSNPLVDNRIWLNCFDDNEEIMNVARRTWGLFHDIAEDEFVASAKPSPLYAPSLIPLLSHPDGAISNSAAKAFARAFAAHPTTVSRNIELLCKNYIDSFPSQASATKAAEPPATKSSFTLASKPKKAAALPKKKAAKPSALSIAGIGKPKSTVKKKSALSSALLKPKAERTLDQAELENQFKSASTRQKSEEEKDSPEKVRSRLGILSALTEVARISGSVKLDETTLKIVTSFLIAYGLADGDDKVMNTARDTLRDIVASNGDSEEAIAFLLPHLEAVLKTGAASESALASLPAGKIPSNVSASDRRKEGVVVALGSVALHLKGEENDSKIDNTIDMLIEALRTPSEDVQLSVADALTKLMKKGKTQDRIEALLAELLQTCLNGSSLAVRRGGAYGLSAAVKGSGITTLKKYDIVKKLVEACSVGTQSEREGSLFAIELLSSRMGLLFEPYVITLLPSLLKSFSDTSDHVRKAASDTSGVIMSKLSAHGVKLVMPAVLTAFNDPAWRTKQASILMLGAMSHLAPKQLASALPKIVPKLTEAFSDTHPKVKGGAQDALEEIKTVVKNPEISSISSVLLKALTDPANNTTKALETLIGTEFLHAIDAPSLALIIPILHRGLRDRGALTKRYAGLIAGNISTMVNDSKDLVPYLPTILPDLQAALLDPIPDVRSTAGKALGSLTRSLGDQIIPEIRPWLIARLRDSSCSSAERSGAAQGLTEVLIASGSSIVDETMRDEILPLRNHPEASTREGVLWMLSFLPPALGQGFSPLISISLPALVAGLSDDSEPVREVALRAGRVLIRSHGKVHVDKILPSLEDGLVDDDHRIRVASLTLLGDLLSMIGGTTVQKGDGGTQDDIRKAERAQAQLALNLGADTRRRVLSRLYMARSDSVHMVRQSALQVWKTVVSVTARTLRDILSHLTARIVEDLASGHAERTVVAGRCLGDVVSKLGDSVLPQIMPVLRNSLKDGDENTKCGVCVGLTEVIKCSTKEQILRFIEIIVKAVKDALSDDSASVRRMAAGSFQSLYTVVGSRAFDEVVPSLMVDLEFGEADDRRRSRALNGLTGILSVRSRELLPYIIPRLIHKPITENHATALAGIAEVTGDSIYPLFSQIIPTLLEEMSDSQLGESKALALKQCAESICKHVDSLGVNILVSEIAAKAGNDKANLRREACSMLEIVISSRSVQADFYEQIPIMIREMVYRLNDDDVSVLKANHAAWSALSKHVAAEELVKHVEFLRNLLASMVSDSRRRKGGVGDGEFLLPGFNMPKGLEPFIPIYQRGILYGNPSTREVSAAGLGEVIDLTASKYLAGPMIVKMTGPLLRIVGDRNPSNVKIAILKTLGLVLVKGGVALRAFVPQFQTTFVKALSDPSRQVRIEAIGALSLLMPLSTRVDPLIKELVAGASGKNASSTDGVATMAVQTATLEALAAVLHKGGSKAKLPASIPSALDETKVIVLNAPDEGVRDSAAKVVGVACALLGPDVASEVLQELLQSCDKDESHRHGVACAIHRILASEVGSEVDAVRGEAEAAAKKLLADDNEPVRQAAAIALLVATSRSSDKKSSFRTNASRILDILNNSRESLDTLIAVGRGFCAALALIEPAKRVEAVGLPLIDGCLKMALTGSQKVQFAFNDALWLLLDVPSGEAGLNKYSDMADFDKVRSMKSLYSKVLTRIKEVKH